MIKSLALTTRPEIANTANILSSIVENTGTSIGTPQKLFYAT